jgi:hypothetical protein
MQLNSANAQQGAVNAVAIDSNESSPHIATVGGDGSLRVWEAATLASVRSTKVARVLTDITQHRIAALTTLACSHLLEGVVAGCSPCKISVVA